VDRLRRFRLSLGLALTILGLALPAVGPALALFGLAVAAAQTVRPTDIVAVDDFIDAARTVFGRTRAQVEQRLGAPAEVRSRTLADGVGPAEAVDELVYPGVAIFVSHRSAAVRRVVLSEARTSLPRGLTVDVARGEVERALGEPQAASDASVMYLYADGFPNTVEFYFRDGRVRRIEWTFAAAD
jgi:hypothetical protein